MFAFPSPAWREGHGDQLMKVGPIVMVLAHTELTDQPFTSLPTHQASVYRFVPPPPGTALQPLQPVQIWLGDPLGGGPLATSQWAFPSDRQSARKFFFYHPTCPTAKTCQKKLIFCRFLGINQNQWKIVPFAPRRTTLEVFFSYLGA